MCKEPFKEKKFSETRKITGMKIDTTSVKKSKGIFIQSHKINGTWVTYREGHQDRVKYHSVLNVAKTIDI